MESSSLRIIDLDDGATRTITWDINFPDQQFASMIESQLREKFGVSEEAWVDLIDLANSSLVNITKKELMSINDPVCLCLSSKTDTLAPIKHKEVFQVTFYEKAIGMTVHERQDCVVVHQFKRNSDGSLGAAEKSKRIQANDIIYKVQGQRTLEKSFENALYMLQDTTRPLTIDFFRPFPREGLFAVEFRVTNLNMTISSNDQNIIVTELPMGHRNIIGYAEAHGVRVNDIIHAIDGHILNGCDEYSRAISLLSRKTRPMIIVFRRSQSSAFTQSTVTTSSAASSTPSHQGLVPRFSFASAVAPSPRVGTSRRNSNGSTMSSVVGDSMLLEDMLDYCEVLAIDGIVSCKEARILKEMIVATRPDLLCAIRRNNRNAIVAIVRSPAMRIWDHLLKTRENILLAGPVSLNRKKRYHMLLTDHERILFINKETNLLEDEIMCSHIVTVSSRSKSGELHISTLKQEYVLIDNFIGAVIWVRAILPFTCTQGYLKVSSTRRLFGSKRRYFVLRRNELTGYKKEQMVHSSDAKSSTIDLKNAKIEVTDPKGFTFAITTPEIAKAGKKLILIASTAREFNKWTAAFDMLQKGTVKALSS
uniref:Uncharacterized protein AlNc14C4G604 n=1 Tax=Albugo laibachii Nc14 TaxID=890382 RepID=F0W0G1_9STRA|nr:conserved hypothetical protein [Albugo laibachii Nc14]|eukprot:CCA14533.1 conserved hypothetical protein [Albugo laibachii Nc14]